MQQRRLDPLLVVRNVGISPLVIDECTHICLQWPKPQAINVRHIQKREGRREGGGTSVQSKQTDQTGSHNDEASRRPLWVVRP